MLLWKLNAFKIQRRLERWLSGKSTCYSFRGVQSLAPTPGNEPFPVTPAPADSMSSSVA